MNIQSLSTSERILLAEQFWGSVRAKSDEIGLSQELIDLLEGRLLKFESDGSLGDNWENVKKRITEK